MNEQGASLVVLRPSDLRTKATSVSREKRGEDTYSAIRSRPRQRRPLLDMIRGTVVKMKTTTAREHSPVKRRLLRLLVAVTACCYVRQGHCKEVDTGDSAEPKNFHRMKIDHLWDHFGCDAIFDSGPRPVHQPSDWMLMRKAYRSIVGPEKASIPDDPPDDDEFLDGFHVQVEARQADEKGRGVFVKAPVKEGQKIWSTSFTARFNSGKDYRRFLAAIPRDFACDVLQWAYVQTLSNNAEMNEKAFVSVDLDAGSFINSYGDWQGGDEDIPPNLGCHKEASKTEPGGCEHNYFALRDIEVDDELLLDYGEFAVSTGWKWFGL